MLGLARLWHIVLLVRARLEARAVGNFRLRIALLLGFSVANVGFGALLYKLASGPGAVSTEDALFTVYSVSSASTSKWYRSYCSCMEPDTAHSTD